MIKTSRRPRISVAQVGRPRTATTLRNRMGTVDRTEMDRKARMKTMQKGREREARVTQMRQESRESLTPTPPPTRVMTPEELAEAVEMLPKLMSQAKAGMEDLLTIMTLASEMMIAVRETIKAHEEIRNRPKDPTTSVVPMRRKAK